MKTRWIDFIGLFLLLLVTGLFWGTWFALSQSISGFSPAEFIHIGKVIISNVAWPMRFILPGCLLFMLLSLWFHPHKRSIGFYFSVIAFVSICISLFITVGIEVPIDNMIKTWTPETIPADFNALREKWEFFHGLRTLTSLSGFALYSASMILTRKY